MLIGEFIVLCVFSMCVGGEGNMYLILKLYNLNKQKLGLTVSSSMLTLAVCAGF